MPHFTEAARKALRGLPRHVQAASVERVGLLAAARPHAWRGVKQLEVQRSVYSARIGIHHRLLFAVQDDELVVEDIIHRAELDHWLSRRS
jgi:mRNA-degrading endonuclease RelE of RelBE toxin-antitoxin system